jgi:hypothetical protein
MSNPEPIDTPNLQREALIAAIAEHHAAERAHAAAKHAETRSYERTAVIQRELRELIESTVDADDNVQAYIDASERGETVSLAQLSSKSSFAARRGELEAELERLVEMRKSLRKPSARARTMCDVCIRARKIARPISCARAASPSACSIAPSRYAMRWRTTPHSSNICVTTA